MMRFFETKIKYTKMLDNGKPKKVTESYVVDALTCTEGEAKTIQHLESQLPEDYAVTSVKETKIAEVINPDSEYFYLVKYAAISLDEKKGEEKETMIEVLVGAEDFDHAVREFKKNMENFTDYDIVSISFTSVLEVILQDQ